MNYCAITCDLLQPIEHGKCVDSILECDHGWKGENCSEVMLCTELCLNGGADFCDQVTDNSTCICPSGYTGDYCETVVSSAHVAMPILFFILNLINLTF